MTARLIIPESVDQAWQRMNGEGPAPTICTSCGDEIYRVYGTADGLFYRDCIDFREWLSFAREHSQEIRDAG